MELEKKELVGKIDRIRGGWIDYYWKFYLIVALWYYIMDSWYLIMNYSLWEVESRCYLGMVLHHIASAHGIIPAFSITYYPWFFTYIFAFHCYLITWPYNKLLHIPYSIGLFHFLYKLFTRPFF